MVDEESGRYKRAEQSIRAMSDLWSSMSNKTNLHVTVSQAKFVSLPRAHPDPVLLKKAMQVMGVLGGGNEGVAELTFIIMPKQGWGVFSKTSSYDSSFQDEIFRLGLLADISGMPELYWGHPFWGDSKKLYVTVAVMPPNTGVIIGMVLEVWRMPLLNPELSDDVSFAMLTAGGEWLPVVITEKPIPVIEFPTAHVPLNDEGRPVLIDDFYYVSKPFKGPPWSMVARYHQRVVASKVIKLFFGALLVRMVILFILFSVMFIVLKLLVAGPLLRTIAVIEKFKPMRLDSSFYDNGKNELGWIAKSCSQLLRSARSQYNLLETRVHMRTQKLEDARKMAELMSRRKSEHIASVSHEIRTPLNGVVGALSLLQQSVLTSRQRELVEVAHVSSNYLLAIINDLLDFSHIEAGQLKLLYEPTDILQVFDQAMLGIYLRAHEKGLVLSTLIADTVPNVMSMDHKRVQQILINLLGNAVKFTERGRIQLSAARNGNLLAIEIEDTGPGIAEEKQRDVFRPFIQLGSHDGGNGLGLTIASRLANLMGGEILLRSKLGKGSCFTFIFPLIDSPAEAERFSGTIIAPKALHPQLRSWGLDPQEGAEIRLDSPALTYLPGRLRRILRAITAGEELVDDFATPLSFNPWSLKVLLVDDVDINRDVISRMLLELGHEVESVASGWAALEHGRRAVYDLVLMDVRMPGMDGYETTRRWRDVNSDVLDADVPIIALTANAMSCEKDRVKEAGMNDYVSKPLNLEQLIDVIERAVSLQLGRGRELKLNTRVQTPILNLESADLREKFRVAMLCFWGQINQAWETRQMPKLQDALHALKGGAGLSGLEDICLCCERLESLLLCGTWPSQQDMEKLRELLTANMMQ